MGTNSAFNTDYEVDKQAWFRLSGYEPHEGQQQLHDSDAQFRVVVAGRRWGKSLSAAEEAERMILTPGTYGWIVSKTYNLTEKVFRIIHRDLVIRQRLKPTSAQISSGPFKLVFPWGSVVEGKSADKPDSLLGEGLDWLIFDECATCKLSHWERYLRPTLIDREGWALFITTPNGYNWVYDLWERGLNSSDHSEWESFKFPSWSNPYLSKSAIEEARKTSSDQVFRQEYGAEFASAVGLVYKRFDIAIHGWQANHDSDMVNQRGFAGWMHYRAIDWGYENPLVMLWFAVAPDDTVYLYDEHYLNHTTIPEHIKIIFEKEREHCNLFGLSAWWQPDNAPAFEGRYQETIADPEGAQQRGDMAEQGIYTTTPSKRSVAEGLELCRQMLKLRDDDTPGFYVDTERCPNFVKEIQSYSFPENTTGRNEKEEPEKKDDHTMDAWRYFVVNWRRGYVTIGVSRY